MVLMMGKVARTAVTFFGLTLIPGAGIGFRIAAGRTACRI